MTTFDVIVLVMSVKAAVLLALGIYGHMTLQRRVDAHVARARRRSRRPPGIKLDLPPGVSRSSPWRGDVR